jgi:amino acid adenylation domain-containing protein
MSIPPPPAAVPPWQAQMPRPTTPFVEFAETELAQSIPDRFEGLARTYPRRLAVQDARRGLTYDELNRAANRVARAILARASLGDGPVAFLLQPGLPQIIAIFGILKAGKIYAALDAELFPPARLALLLKDWQASLVVTDDAHLSLARELLRGDGPPINLEALDPDLAEDNPGLSLSPESPALILYTSGSTGQPKGVVHSHRNVLHYTRLSINGIQIGKDDRLALLGSCSFAGSIASIFPALLSGAALLPFDLKTQGLPNLARWLIESEITIYISVTSLFRHMVSLLNGAETFPKLRLISIGGEPVTRRDVELYRKHFAADCLLGTGLAATEMLTVLGQFLDKDTPVNGVWVPLGYPAPGSEVLLLDEAGRELGPNEVGEIAVRSPYLALGYWRDPELTRRVFRADSGPDKVRTCHMGDLGLMRPDGCFEYRGRKDSQIKVRGHRVDVAEIETALLEVNGIKQAVVVGRADGAGDRRLVAYLVPTSAAPPTVSELRKALRERLPSYMIPSAFVFLNKLPLTPTNKVDRQALPPPAANRPTLGDAYARPQDSSEVLLAQIWENCLSIQPVGVDDNFFELGGDSFLAAEMLAEVEQVFRKKLSPEVLLGSTTVRQLAREMARQPNGPEVRRLAEVQPGDPGHRLFFLHGDVSGGGLYCVNLARYLGNDQGFYALPPHGVIETSVPATIEEMAADNLRVLSDFQPQGPYRLGGHCNGALIAFEMAQQLRQRGEHVDLVVMIAPPWSVQFHPPFFVSPYCFGLPNPLASRLPPTDVSRVPPEQLGRVLLSLYQEACRNYLVRPYPGRVIVIEPQEDAAIPKWERLARQVGANWMKAFGKLPSAGVSDFDWRTVAAQVELWMAPGNHITVVATHAPAVADYLRERLERPLN